MKPLSRRRAVLAALAAIGSGCLYLGNTAPTQSRTQVRSATLASATPPLGAFVIRVAASDLDLDAEQARVIGELVHDADESIRPLDDARVTFLEVLVRAVTEHRYDEATVAGAAAAVLVAARTTSMRLLHALVKLHGVLEPEQRRLLVARVGARWDGWAAAWHGGAPQDHPWLATFLRPAFPEDTRMIEDAVRIASRWADETSAEVRDACARPTLDDDDRRKLLERLRRAQGVHAERVARFVHR
ncbi:MAG: hypothetical protein KIT84_16440 [Labilithrix sp.]|nr:hypothetical protein [Labilithrix sp.]MCW5812619.1 hypothetical protein [Labilithrix sp.]